MRLVLFCALAVFSSAPALAEFAGQNLPDLNGLQSVFGDVVSGKTNVEENRDALGLLGSGIAVPDRGARGRTAKALAGSLGGSLGKEMDGNNVAATFEKAFIDGVAGVENALPQMGMQKRDYGVGFALFFVMTWELANDARLDKAAAVAAGENLIKAVQVASEGQNTPGERLDAGYDMFLTIPVALLALQEGYENNGLTTEAAQIREYAGEAFEQVVGMSPYDIDITDTGEIKGY